MIVECPGCRSRYDVTGRPAGTMARCRCGASFPLPAPPEWAAGLACPNCAAVCPPDRDQCAFCGAVLAVVACPRCFGKAFLGSKHCRHCGAGIDEAARTFEAAAARRCPRCPLDPQQPVHLVAHLVGETLLDTCARCGGVWVDMGALQQIVAERDRQSALVAVGQPSAAAPVPITGQEAVRYLRCPDCDGVMSRVNFAKRSGVIVDVCRGHGTWFDKDELRAVVDFVMKGGIHSSQQKDLEEVRREVRAKEEKIRSLGGSTGAAADWDGHDVRASWWKVSLFSEILAMIFRLTR